MTLSPPSWLRPSIEARTKFVDEQVLAAISSGVRQIVVCGAGYDDRALRFRSAGVRFFELDHPSTQADKQRRLLAIARPTEVAGGGPGTEPSGTESGGTEPGGTEPSRTEPSGPDPLRRLGVTLAAADFRSDEVGTVLGRCGHNRDMPSLFLCEGLLVYLDVATCRRLLGGLAASATERSVLVATLATHADGLDSAEVIAAANARRRTADAEPWRTILPAAEHVRMLQQAGWAVTGMTDSPVPSADVSHGRQSILVTASPAR
jgi:O-methyltransferase involved in polyketide biosynthesis